MRTLTLALILAAAPGLFLIHSIRVPVEPVLLLSFPIAFSLFAVLFDAVKFQRARQHTLILFSICGMLNILGLIVAWQFQRLTHLQFSLTWAAESMQDSMRTTMQIFSPAMIFTLGLGLTLAAACAFSAFYVTFQRLSRRLHEAPARKWESPVLAALLLLSTFAYGRTAYSFINDMRTLRAALSSVPPRAVTIPASKPGASVIFLHLESVNAPAAFQLAPEEPFGYRAKIPQPGIEKVWRDGAGVFFPYFWANSFATNRGVESILCGVVGNLAHGVDSQSSQRPKTPCLPAELKSRGYKSLYFYSYFNLDFYDFRNLLPALGFEHVVYGPELMQEGDAKSQWGYDDCVFYRRLGEYFAGHPELNTDPLFAYVEVSMHHSPFESNERYREIWPYPNPANPLEEYLNSVSGQDACLPKFIDAIEKLGRKDLHVVIAGDHSMPLLQTVDLEDRFMTTFLYLPPAGESPSRKARAIATHSPPSQADIYATLSELLYATHSPYSFAPALMGGAYEAEGRCETLANQYGLLSYVRKNRRASYSIGDGYATLQESADEGSTWSVKTETMSLMDFQKRYACE